eukprot:5468122-Pyramimonas_sp.AAC.1
MLRIAALARAVALPFRLQRPACSVTLLRTRLPLPSGEERAGAEPGMHQAPAGPNGDEAWGSTTNGEAASWGSINREATDVQQWGWRSYVTVHWSHAVADGATVD